MGRLNLLTNREWEVVKFLLQGKSNKQIALALGISRRTVEFHLKNIYAKYEVGTRIELVLELRNAIGQAGIEKPVHSTVVNKRGWAENRDLLSARTDWGTSYKHTVSIIGKELQLKNLNTKHVPAGMIAALITGFVWIALLKRFGHMTFNAIEPWILPLIVILVISELTVGLIGKRNGNKPANVFLSTLSGTGAGAITMLPLTAIVVVPLGKLAERLGLIYRSAVPSEVAASLVIISMLVMWLIVGTVIGSMFLNITIKKPEQADIQRHASEHGLG